MGCTAVSLRLPLGLPIICGKVPLLHCNITSISQAALLMGSKAPTHAPIYPAMLSSSPCFEFCLLGAICTPMHR